MRVWAHYTAKAPAYIPSFPFTFILFFLFFPFPPRLISFFFLGLHKNILRQGKNNCTGKQESKTMIDYDRKFRLQYLILYLEERDDAIPFVVMQRKPLFLGLQGHRDAVPPDHNYYINH
jgi:hypothetical protein